MKLLNALLITAIAVTCSCKQHEEQETDAPDKTKWERVLEKRDFYVSNYTPAIFQQRCDNLTFMSLWSAFTSNAETDVYGLELRPGEWHRDTKGCFPNDSKSEISRDGFIMLLNYLRVQEDSSALHRIWDYGVEHNWIMGDGPWKLTNMLPLVPVLAKMINKEWTPPVVAYNVLSMDIDSHYDAHTNDVKFTKKDLLTGFRGHLLTMYLYLVGKLNGSLNELEFKAVQMLYEENSNNPLVLAVYHRFGDGDQGSAIEILNSDVKNPWEVTTETGVYGWGSCPKIVHFVTAVGILEGI